MPTKSLQFTPQALERLLSTSRYKVVSINRFHFHEIMISDIPADARLCTAGDHLVRKPVVSSCGCVYCKECITFWTERPQPISSHSKPRCFSATCGQLFVSSAVVTGSPAKASTYRKSEQADKYSKESTKERLPTYTCWKCGKNGHFLEACPGVTDYLPPTSLASKHVAQVEAADSLLKMANSDRIQSHSSRKPQDASQTQNTETSSHRISGRSQALQHSTSHGVVPQHAGPIGQTAPSRADIQAALTLVDMSRSRTG